MFDQFNELSAAIYKAQQAIEAAQRIAKDIQLALPDSEDETIVENLTLAIEHLEACDEEMQEAAECGDECTDVFCNQ